MCSFVEERSQHGRTTANMLSCVIGADGPSTFSVSVYVCATHAQQDGESAAIAGHGRYDCLSAQVLKEMESDPDLVLDPDVLFVANSNRYAFDQSAVRFLYEHFSTVAHDYS